MQSGPERYMQSNLYREWSEKAAKNALALAEESIILLNAERLSRAYYLAHMSTEESAKSILLYTMSTSGTPESELPKVNVLLRNHRKKIEFLVSCAASISPHLAEKINGLQADLVSHINNLKNNTMYVSVEKNLIRTPEEKISGIPVYVYVEFAEHLASHANSLQSVRSKHQDRDIPGKF